MAELDVAFTRENASELDPDCSQPLDPEENGDPDVENGIDCPLNTNYDSCDGTIQIHRCDRCENYESLSHTSLLAHVAHCPGPPDGHLRKMFECDICNMKFSNGANMRRHKMRHTGVKPYECRVCQKRFFRKDHLAEHFTTHTKTLPYHCPICNRGFQRQIAMRAHFQNEHVGQHDMIKSCPLCSYRAASMKSLRVHFFNRHGIDLDNPGPSTPQPVSGESTGSLSVGGGGSDSGDSTGARSADNATPPMHFLTPHVEISMTEVPSAPPQPYSSPMARERDEVTVLVNGTSCTPHEGSTAGDCPGSPQSADSNTEVAPSVSLIPLQSEPDEKRPPPSTTLIKVSPLKSLLRENNAPPPACDSWRGKRITSSLHCVFCGIGFPDQTLYFLHKGCHSDSNPWKCNICGEQCCNVYDFNSHLLSKTHQ